MNCTFVACHTVTEQGPRLQAYCWQDIARQDREQALQVLVTTSHRKLEHDLMLCTYSRETMLSSCPTQCKQNAHLCPHLLLSSGLCVQK